MDFNSQMQSCGCGFYPPYGFWDWPSSPLKDTASYKDTLTYPAVIGLPRIFQ